MADEADLETFDEALAELEGGLAGASDVTAAFGAELARMRESATLTRGQVASLSTAIGSTLRGAFEDLALEGGTLSAALRRVADGLSRAAFGAAITPVENRIGDLAAAGIERAVGAAVPFAEGGVFTRGRVMPFASGGVVSLAHPGHAVPHRVVLALIDAGLDAVEVVHPSHDEMLETYYRALAERYSLLMTGGSDFHEHHGREGRDLGRMGFTPDEELLQCLRTLPEV